MMAVGLPAAFFCGLEGSLRIAGYGKDFHFLIPDAASGYYRSNPDFAGWFMPSAFDLRAPNFRIAKQKPEGSVRVVVLGESAAQGVPAPEFGFAPQLGAMLRARFPGKKVEVINTGIVAINSHVVLQIARQMAQFSPDLFVVYAGNNEVVGPYGPGCAYLSQMPPLPVIRMSVWVRATRTGQLLASLVGRLRGSGEASAWGGMAMFARDAVRGDDPRLEAVYANFAGNLNGIVEAARGCGAGCVLCTVVSNLKDCAPFLSLHGRLWKREDERDWSRYLEKGKLEWMLGDYAAGASDLSEALARDPEYAQTAFMLGKCEWELGREAAARAHFLQAQHWDSLRFRPDPRINEVVRAVAAGAQGRVVLADAALELGSDPLSSAPAAGRGLLHEHVHLDFEGSYRLAALVEKEAERLLEPGSMAQGEALPSAACARAVGYSEVQRQGVLERIDSITRNAPFTGQVTYVVDQARFARELSQARQARSDRARLLRARQDIQAALALNPADPMLTHLAAELAQATGDLAGALELLRVEASLVPATYGLVSEQAMMLARLGRYDEAQRLLDDASSRLLPRDAANLAPAYAELYVRSGRIDEGRRRLGILRARFPADIALEVLVGKYEALAGNDRAAQSTLSRVLESHPQNAEALEALVESVRRLEGEDAALALSLQHVDSQPGNQLNLLRAAVLCARRGDDEGQGRYLLMAEGCGPVTHSVESRVARSLFRKNEPDAALLHLAQARAIALLEGDDRAVQSIDRAISEVAHAP